MRGLRAVGPLRVVPASLSLEHNARGGVVGGAGGDAATQHGVDRCCLRNIGPLFANGDMRAAR